MYEKLTVDRLINFTRPLWPGGVPPAATIPAQFFKQPKQFLNIEESAKVMSPATDTKQRTSDVVAGAHASKTRRTFGWLTWLPGSISYVNMDGHDVLTGPMSGCDIVAYRQGGKTYVAHLGTDHGKDAANAAVKACWNAFAQAHPQDLIGGFNPLRGDTKAIPPAKPGDQTGGIVVYGLVTTNFRFYAVGLWTQRQISSDSKMAHATLKRIAFVRRIPSHTNNTLQNL